MKVIRASEAGCPDLICCIPIEITQDMVGRTIGVFVAAEMKRSYKENPSEIQEVRIEQIKAAKGLAGVVVEVSDFEDLMRTIEEIH